MPIYEYACTPCASTFEAFLMSASEDVTCPKCGGADISRRMSTFAASVPGGYKATQAGASAPAAAPSAPTPGGHVHSGGCCH